MSQDTASANETSAPGTNSENDQSFIDIGAQFEEIEEECYTRDISEDIPAEGNEEGHVSVPVGWALGNS